MDEGQAPEERGPLREDSRLDDLADGAYGSETPAQYQARRDRIYATSLRVWFSREFGYLCVLDPHTGEVYEIEFSESPRWMKRRAFEEKDKRRRSATSPAWPRHASTG
jgi:hypothetical protein